VFGFSLEKLVIIAAVAAFLLGPNRLPQYASKLATLTKRVRVMTDNLKAAARSELGPEFDEVDWKKLDPRQYDPRRIIRDALSVQPAEIQEEGTSSIQRLSAPNVAVSNSESADSAN
jgi:sec-independent protein translocase protein TatB